MHTHPQSVLEFVNVCSDLSSDSALKGHVGFISLGFMKLVDSCLERLLA